LFGSLGNMKSTPISNHEDINGISLRAASSSGSVNISIDAISSSGLVIESKEYTISEGPLQPYEIRFLSVPDLSKVEISVSSKVDSNYFSSDKELVLDDIYLLTDREEVFLPPEKNSDLLDWIEMSGINYFVWNYKWLDDERGVVLEKQNDEEIVSVSGIGYALAVYIIAIERGVIEESDAKNRVLAMMRWLEGQNWYDGTHGWHGFPYHWFTTDGDPHWDSVSTIDWAMLAAGLRTAKQYFSYDSDIVSLANGLLDRPDWNAVMRSNGKIAMGLLADSGDMDPYSWGLSFSEESELVYLESVASGQFEAEIYDNLSREKKHGFYPSWFAAGFTYNWLQLWTGPLPKLARNSRQAFLYDAKTSEKVFGRELMGLTAVGSFSRIDDEGFRANKSYYSNQGSEAHGAPNPQEVVQHSPAPYGAALGLLFAPDESLKALREYVELGYFHPYLGLPDSIRISGLPGGYGPVPSWIHYDLNIGSMVLAISQYRDGLIPKLYLKDPDVFRAVEMLKKNHEVNMVFEFY